MRLTFAALAVAITLASPTARADEFTGPETERWQKEFQTVATQGRALWTDGALGTNGVACGQCHPNAANTHPETYPKFQKQLGKVAQLFEMVNWCLKNPLEGKPLAADDPKMTALISYVYSERKGVKLSPGTH